MSVFISAFALGLAFVATPGAVTAQSIRRGLQRGFQCALSLQFGAMIGLALWAIVAFMGAAVIAQSALARIILSGVGALLLGQLAWRALRDAYRSTPLNGEPSSTRGDFALGATLSLASPLPVAFWLGIGMSSVGWIENRFGDSRERLRRRLSRVRSLFFILPTCWRKNTRRVFPCGPMQRSPRFTLVLLAPRLLVFGPNRDSYAQALGRKGLPFVQTHA